MDFELNQKFCDPAANPTNCANNGSGVTPETPLRTIGDKLITYDLAKGGTVPTISIRTWGGSVWGAPTVISGGANAQALGSVNTSTIAASGADGLGTNPSGGLDPLTFGEASINFSAIFGGGGACGTFGSAYLKSRSSDSFPAELKDFIAPERVNITNCTGITTTLSASSITVGGSAHDSATLTGATSNAGGTVTYTVYTDNACTLGARDAGTKTVSGGVVPDSNSLTFNTVGTFYWQAVYSGDVNNAPSTSVCTSEVLVVNKANPSIATLLSASSITVGDSAHDSATLTGATSNAGGTVTYTVYTNNTCTAGARDAGTKTVAGGVVPDSNTLQFDSAGTFYWQAVYSGDGNNNGATSDCTSEVLVVAKAPSNIATAQRLFPQDSATVSASAGGTPTGSVTFSLYAPGDTTCSGSAVYSETVNLSGGTATTSNTTFSVVAGTSGIYRWVVTYSGDGTHEGSTSACGTEQFTATITNS
jgi:hypothetical protein